MSSKSISTGTLSLKFMQNAHRAKQLKEVELDRAEVKDDGMWEVNQAVRDAWGLPKDSISSYKDIHESSYLPFIFSATSSVEADDSFPEVPSRKIAGRRTFNNNGEEVSQSASTPDMVQLSAATPTTADTSESSPRRKIHQRPISISSSGTSGQLKGFEQKDTKTARQAIFDSGGVGTDLRAPSRKNAFTSTSTTTFMKPAGVDDPKNIHSLPTPGSILEGARLKKIKRERDNGDEPSDSKKKMKKRKLPE